MKVLRWRAPDASSRVHLTGVSVDEKGLKKLQTSALCGFKIPENWVRAVSTLGVCQSCHSTLKAREKQEAFEKRKALRTRRGAGRPSFLTKPIRMNVRLEEAQISYLRKYAEDNNLVGVNAAIRSMIEKHRKDSDKG